MHGGAGDDPEAYIARRWRGAREKYQLILLKRSTRFRFDAYMVASVLLPTTSARIFYRGLIRYQKRWRWWWGEAPNTVL